MYAKIKNKNGFFPPKFAIVNCTDGLFFRPLPGFIRGGGEGGGILLGKFL